MAVYGRPLEQVKEYKYRGVTFSENSIFKSTRANQANKALFSLMKILSNLSYPKPCYLFDLLVTPIMNYASETWDYTVSDYNDSLELVHRKFCSKFNSAWRVRKNSQILVLMKY